MVYVWGCNGYGRMGLGTGLQHDVLVPKFVPQVRLSKIGADRANVLMPPPQFAGPNKPTTAEDISAGPTSTVVIDRQRMYWLAGKVSALVRLWFVHA